MSCSQCPHCRALANPAALTLSRQPTSSPQTGSDLEFYREFGLAYDRARTLRLRPRQALTAANPWLSDSQCTAYLKRARAYGFVQSAPRRDVGRTPAPTPAPVREAVAIPEAAPAVPRRGKRGGRLQALTGEQCRAVFYSGEPNMDLLLDNAGVGVPVTAEKLCRAHTAKLTEREAMDVLQWAVNSGAWEWSVPGESILPVDG
jgi:hypothetical protein